MVEKFLPANVTSKSVKATKSQTLIFEVEKKELRRVAPQDDYFPQHQNKDIPSQIPQFRVIKYKELHFCTLEEILNISKTS